MAELLMSLAPLMNDIGVRAEWQLLCHDDPFYEVTKGFHNALQGKPFRLTDEHRERYLRRNRTCAGMIEGEYDAIIVHDPQPAARCTFRPDAGKHWIWRCHIDTSDPNPEVWGFVRPFVESYERLRIPAESDPDLHLFTNITGVHAHEVNAFQRIADVALQKSIREGFGLVVAEAMWKETPVIGGRVGGITLQIEDGVSGFLVSTVDEAASRVIELCENPELADRLGRAGREGAREKLLITRLLEDWLRLLGQTLGTRSAHTL